MRIYPRLSRLETSNFCSRRVYATRRYVRPKDIATLEFFRAVTSAGKKQEFYRLMMVFGMRNRDQALIPDLLHNLKELMKDNRQLLLMYHALLPERYKFEIPDEAGSEIERENN